jgi:hypothetical protein
VANIGDPIGVATVIYFMPRFPRLAADGTAGYNKYLATSVPAPFAQALCTTEPENVVIVSRSIQNDNNNITLGYRERAPYRASQNGELLPGLA